MPAVILKCLDKCSDRFIPDLYKALHETQQKEPTVILKCLDKCHHELILSLYKACHRDALQNSDIVSAFLNTCLPKNIYFLYQKLPRENKTDPELNKKVIGLCPSNLLPELIKAMPNIDQDTLITALKLNTDVWYVAPDSLKTPPFIAKACFANPDLVWVIFEHNWR